MSVDAVNDDRVATDGAVEVAGAEPPDSVFYRLWLADIRGLQEALRQDAEALQEIVEWCKAHPGDAEQEESCNRVNR